MPEFGRTILCSLLICCAFSLLPGGYAAADQEDEDTPVFTQGEVIVTGKKDPAEKTASVETITAKDIKTAGARNAAEALQLAAGIRIDTAPTSISGNGKAEMLGSLRGFDPRNVIVLLDGVPVYEPYFRVLDLRQIPAGDIAKIKIIKGATSVLYGPNALGGIINIITKKGQGPAKGHLEGAYGNVGRILGNGSVLGGHKGFEYYFSPGFEKSEGFAISDDYQATRNEDGGLRSNSDFQDYHLAGKFGYSKAANSVYLTANHYEFQGGVPFSMEAAQPATLWRKDWRKTAAAVYGTWSPADFLLAKGNAHYTRFYNTITTYEDTNISSVADGGDAVSTFDNNVAGFSVLPEFFFGKKSGSMALSGIYKFDTVSILDETGGDWSDFGSETMSGGSEYRIAFYKFALSAGAAYHFFRRTETPGNDLGEDNSAVDYMAGLSYAPLDQLELYTAAARKSSFPDLRTLYSSNGNPDLKPEYALNIDAGIRLRPVPWLYAFGTWFYSDVTDLIGKKDTGNTFTYENVDQALITGVESGLDMTFLGGVFIFGANHIYMRTQDNRPGRIIESLDFRPEHKAVFDGRINAPFGTALAVQFYFTGERKYERQGVNAVEESLPEYGIVNARLSQAIRLNEKTDSLEIYIEAKNLADVYYEMSPERAAPGRSMLAGLLFEF